MSKMHICLVTSDRIFDTGAYGGEGQFTIALGNWLLNHEDIVTVIGSKFLDVDSKTLNKKDRINFLSATKQNSKNRVIYPPYILFMLSSIITCIQWIIKIIQVNRKFPISIIHVQNTGYSGLASIIAGKLLGIPVVVTSHGIRYKTLESIIKGRLKKILLKIERSIDILTIKNSHGVIAVNKSIKSHFEEIVSKNIDYIPTPIIVKNFEYSKINRQLVRKDLGIENDHIIIGFIGRFSPEKNLLTLLKAFDAVSQKEKNLFLILVGSGPQEDIMKEYVKNHQLKVLFLGIRYDISEILSSLDIFILPSYNEGLSTALLEAMSNSKAIICSNIEANIEIVSSNKEALIFNPNDITSLTNAIILLIHDAKLRSEIGNNARKKVNMYDNSVLFPLILNYYKIKTKENNM